jgi:C4-dicarboxylate transporter
MDTIIKELPFIRDIPYASELLLPLIGTIMTPAAIKAEPKKANLLVIFIVLLVLLLIGVSIYFLVDYLSNKDTKETMEDVLEEEDCDCGCHE